MTNPILHKTTVFYCAEHTAAGEDTVDDVTGLGAKKPPATRPLADPRPTSFESIGHVSIRKMDSYSGKYIIKRVEAWHVFDTQRHG